VTTFARLNRRLKTELILPIELGLLQPVTFPSSVGLLYLLLAR